MNNDTRMKRNVALSTRFWSQVKKTAGCWNWKTKNVRGYGKIMKDGKARKATHISWEINVGPPPKGLHCLHRCDNPACVRPSHLFWGTEKENKADMVFKGRSSRGNAVHGSKLTEAQAFALKAAHATGRFTYRELGGMFGISGTGAHKIIKGKNWKYLKKQGAFREG